MKFRFLPFLFLLLCGQATAQNIDLRNIDAHEYGPQQQELSQKFRMADYLLGSEVKSRIEREGGKSANQLVQKAQRNFELAVAKANDKIWLEANAVIDSVLRDLTTSASMLNAKSFSQNKYDETRKRVTAFVYPQWTRLSENDKALLDDTSARIDLLDKQASSLAENQQYDDATDILLTIYNLKSQLLQRLKHDRTIVYDLIFDTPDEEFEYLKNRRDHFNGLFARVLEHNTFDVQTLKLVNLYRTKSETGAQEADLKKNNNEHKQASQILEKSIRDLSTALKILGVKI